MLTHDTEFTKCAGSQREGMGISKVFSKCGTLLERAEAPQEPPLARGRAQAERVDVRGVLAHLDVSQLPDELVARLAAGENPISVLAPVLQASELPALPPGEEGGES